MMIDFFTKISYYSLISELQRYGLDSTTVGSVHNWLSYHTQRVNINSSTSNQRAVIIGAPQGSVWEPALFNIWRVELMDCLSNL